MTLSRMNMLTKNMITGRFLRALSPSRASFYFHSRFIQMKTEASPLKEGFVKRIKPGIIQLYVKFFLSYIVYVSSLDLSYCILFF